ncbi:MAG: DUF4190 domain-containing protein [Clostridium sp.]|nr:DUF4190 domain-containing protein [Clostridium sp.]MCM1443733.1 DUF4190 domain-containing protein [Candidatus Amulumruptor caecigallinarius]
MDNNQNVPTQENNSTAIAALVLGIVSVVFAFIFTWIGLIAGIVAIILAVKGMKNPVKKGMATAGLVLGIIGTALSGIFIACALCIIGTASSAINSLYY